ncbi:MAG: hypothetical protein HY648_13930, partial [Acidobacteria bacterium]|nr:hypothetical protein [Acidobacteriota bacterium]
MSWRVHRAAFAAATAALLVSASVPLSAQNADWGVAVPFTVTGGIQVTERPQLEDPSASKVRGGFRAVAYPTLKLGPRWFFYSALQARLEPFLYYQAYEPEVEPYADVLQTFLGYGWTGENKAFTVKFGKLPSAFGAFPLRYDDTANPLLDQPMSYAYPVKLRPDQYPCGVEDIVHQSTYNLHVEHYCGGSKEKRTGMIPVTLYGLPGAEINLGWKKLDGRFQLTNSSPANPKNLLSDDQHLQWAAGAGLTIWQGFRVGASGYRGTFLEEDVASLLPKGTTLGDYPATGVGTDIQWALGRWSASAEWQRFEYNYPRFRTSPAVSYGYLETKVILSPRFYAALRAGYENHGWVEDLKGVTS